MRNQVLTYTYTYINANSDSYSYSKPDPDANTPTPCDGRCHTYAEAQSKTDRIQPCLVTLPSSIPSARAVPHWAHH